MRVLIVILLLFGGVSAVPAASGALPLATTHPRAVLRDMERAEAA